ncbi:AbrB/MazE/SpoVT family DNA-binding domain-containing protein [Rhodoferax sp.]|uniref:AbrB/MazE/SpoVT family DNA-binding domain-containing protein n=1 Tax=Rhodoferax sp. TaxID=50421 RepID=UPI002760C3AF|nr:AbrB/MazE/SpoVT family DNA-binding domain-containing protein [Rhodoferax sp.]
MELQIGKWGNSLALRLPATVVKKMRLREGVKIELSVQADGSATLTAPQAFDLSAYMAEVRSITKSMPVTPSVIEAMRDDARY